MNFTEIIKLADIATPKKLKETLNTTLPYIGPDGVWYINGVPMVPKLDPTLTEEGMAADAKAVGDTLLEKVDKTNLENNYYDKTQTDAALSGKVDKLEGSQKVYARGYGENKDKDVGITYSTGITILSIPLWESTTTGGCLNTSTPLNNKHCANKEYVDNSIKSTKEEIGKKLNLISNTLTQGGILGETEISQGYAERVTANGENIVDEQETIVSKIQGVSAVSENLITFTPFSRTDYSIDFTLDENCILTASGGGQSGSEAFVNIATFVAPKTGTYYFSANIERGATSKNNEDITLFDEFGNFILANTQFSATEGQTFSVTFVASSIYNAEYDVYLAPADCVIKSSIYDISFNGVKNSYFKGVESYGRNLFDINKITGLKDTGGSDKSSSVKVVDGKINVKIGKYSVGVYFTGNERYLSAGKYRVSFDVDMNSATGGVYYGFFNPRETDAAKKYIQKSQTNLTPYSTYHFSGTITLLEDGIYHFFIQGGGKAGTSTKLDIEFYNVQYEYGEVEHSYMPYGVVNNSFMLDIPIELGQYDYIDIENKKLVKQTAVLTQDTKFTEEQLANYPNYILSVDGKTIAYMLDTATETPIELSKGYQVWVGGTEKCIQGDIDNNEFGASPIITQSYFIVIGGNE